MPDLILSNFEFTEGIGSSRDFYITYTDNDTSKSKSFTVELFNVTQNTSLSKTTLTTVDGSNTVFIGNAVIPGAINTRDIVEARMFTAPTGVTLTGWPGRVRIDQ